MSKKSQHNNILLAVIGFSAVVILVGVIGFFTLEQKYDTIQGEVEVSEYRVSCKLPGRVVATPRSGRRLRSCGRYARHPRSPGNEIAGTDAPGYQRCSRGDEGPDGCRCTQGTDSGRLPVGSAG